VTHADQRCGGACRDRSRTKSPFGRWTAPSRSPWSRTTGSTLLLLGQSHGGDIDDHGRVQVKDVLHLLGEPFVELGGEGGDALCRSQETTAADLGEHALPYPLDQFLCRPLLVSGDLTDLLRLRLCELDAEYRHAHRLSRRGPSPGCSRVPKPGERCGPVPLGKTMRDTGRDMHDKSKETSLGGSAVNVIAADTPEGPDTVRARQWAHRTLPTRRGRPGPFRPSCDAGAWPEPTSTSAPPRAWCPGPGHCVG